MFWRWLLSAVLLIGALWSTNLALGNWWAAGGPPTEHPETFAFRGNVFFALACLLFLASAFTVVLNIRRLRKS